jgi:zinc protease
VSGDAESDFFMRVLGGGKTSRLYRKLVYEQQIAQTVKCENNSLTLTSTAQCDVTARPGVKPEDLQAAIARRLVCCARRARLRRSWMARAQTF